MCFLKVSRESQANLSLRKHHLKEESLRVTMTARKTKRQPQEWRVYRESLYQAGTEWCMDELLNIGNTGEKIIQDKGKWPKKLIKQNFFSSLLFKLFISMWHKPEVYISLHYIRIVCPLYYQYVHLMHPLKLSKQGPHVQESPHHSAPFLQIEEPLYWFRETQPPHPLFDRSYVSSAAML